MVSSDSVAGPSVQINLVRGCVDMDANNEHEICQNGKNWLLWGTQHPVMRYADSKCPFLQVLVIFHKNRGQILTDSAGLPSFSRASAPKIL